MGQLKVWNFIKGQQIGEICEEKRNQNGIYSLIYNKEHNYLISGSCQKPKKYSGKWNHTIKVWNRETQKFCFSLNGHQGGISGIVDLGNDLIISSSADTTLKVWDISKKELKGTLKGHQGYVYGLAKITQGSVVSGSKDGAIRVWDIEQEKSRILGDPEASAQSHASTVYDVASHGFNILASASRDGYVKVWDLRTNKAIKVLEAAEKFMFSVTFSEDGKLIAGFSGKNKPPKEGGGAIVWGFSKQLKIQH